MASDDVESDMHVERFNMRGVHGRQLFEGGDQERQLALDNKDNAVLAAAWPRTSSMLQAIAMSWKEDSERQDLDAAQRKLRS